MKSNRYAKAVKEFHDFLKESSKKTDEFFDKIRPKLDQYLQKGDANRMKEYKKLGKPILRIETDAEISDEMADKIYTETDKYSITPTTFKLRSFPTTFNINLKEKLIQVENKLKETQDVLQEKISNISVPLKENVNMKLMTEAKAQELLGKDELYITLTNRETQLKQYQKMYDHYTTHFNDSKLLIFVDEYSNNAGNAVIRYGLNSQLLSDVANNYNKTFALLSKAAPSKKSGKTNQEEQSTVTLHPLEVEILAKAIDSLLKEDKKTVLIDIFARNDKEQIQFDVKSNLPETHTVALYKNGDKDIVVIDPSNSAFSKHLSSEMNNLLISSELMNDTLKAPSKEIKIYTPDKNIGSKPEQYRDCIDIAVKIAFGLNKHEDAIDRASIGELAVIQEITNQKGINEGFMKEYGVARIRQASDDKIRNTAEKIMDKLYQQRESFSKYKKSDDVIDKIIKTDIQSFKKQYTPEQYNAGLHELLDTLKSNQLEINEFLISDIDLLGTVID